jgi:hypothetical protein
MMLRDLEIEALYEGPAQRGFGVSSLEGEHRPLGSKSHPEKPPRTYCPGGGVEGAPDVTGIKTLWIKKHSNPKQMNTGDDQ